MSKRDFRILLVVVLALNWVDFGFQHTAYASASLQDNIEGQCRAYTQEASKDSLDELNEHQKIYLNFRTRQIAENVPPQLVDETQEIISDYQKAIEFTQQAIAGESSQDEWRKALASLRLLAPCETNATPITESDSYSNRILGGLIIIIISGIVLSAAIYRKRTTRHKTS